ACRFHCRPQSASVECLRPRRLTSTTTHREMTLDPVLLVRLQFDIVIAFHILLPAFTVGLASFIVLLEGLHLVKRNPLYLRLSVFWTRIFAVSFGMGVVSGIVMPFQFGTNWSRYTDATGNVLGPLFAYEG